MKRLDGKGLVQRVIALGLGALCMGLNTCSAEAPNTPAARVRPSAVAGSWYPANPGQLGRIVDSYIKAAAVTGQAGRLYGVIAPHAGYRYSGHVAGYSYKCVERGSHDRVIVLAPSHHAWFRGFSIMNVTAYRTPLGDVPLDADICRELRSHKLHADKDEIHVREHSIEIQLPFLQRTTGRFKLVPILVGYLSGDDAAKIAAALKPYVSNKTLVIVSTDFTHYGRGFQYVPFEKDVEENLRKLDLGAARLIRDKNYEGYMAYIRDKRPTICGRNAIAILLKLLPTEVKGRLLKYDTSGRMTGDFSQSVSYVSMAFTYPSGAKRSGLTTAEKKTLVRLARQTIKTYLKTGRMPKDVEGTYNLTDRLKGRSGAFVTLKKHGELRGCIGRIGYPELASQLPPLYEVIIRMAVAAATEDPRFPQVTAAELADIKIEISVLTIAKEIPGHNDFEVGRHGIIIRKGRRSAVFLPQVAPEQGWNRATTLQHLCRKAGMPSDEWKTPGMKFFVFTADVFDETVLHRKTDK